MLLPPTEFTGITVSAWRKAAGGLEGWEQLELVHAEPHGQLWSCWTQLQSHPCWHLCPCVTFSSGALLLSFSPKMVNIFPLPSLKTNTACRKKVKFKCQTQKLRGFKSCLVYVSTYWKLAQTCHYRLWDTTADVTEWKSLFPAKVFAGDAITRCHCTAVGKGSEQRGEREEAARGWAGLGGQAASSSALSLPTNSDSPSCPFLIPVRTL